MELDQLIAQAKTGDNDAKSYLYKEYMTPLYRFVYVRIRDKEEASDIVQDAFIRAFAALPRFNDQGKGMLPYLFTIARNLIINRSKKKHSDAIDYDFLNAHDSGDRTDTESLLEDTRSDIVAAMKDLTDTEREIIALKFYGERSYSEIAEELNKREDAVRQHVARAIKKMREALNTKENETY